MPPGDCRRRTGLEPSLHSWMSPSGPKWEVNYGLANYVGSGSCGGLPEMALLSPIPFRHLIRKQMTTAGNTPLLRIATIDDAARIGGLARAAYIKIMYRA